MSLVVLFALFYRAWTCSESYFSIRGGRAFLGRIGRMIVPLILIAEICSWYAVISTNYLGNSLEESLWTVTYTLIGLALFLLSRQIMGPLKWAARAGVFGCVLYVGFMATVDVPMYVQRWQGDIVAGKDYLDFWQGIYDFNKRWIVTYSMEDWRTEVPWMSLYFSVAVWVSVALCKERSPLAYLHYSNLQKAVLRELTENAKTLLK